MTTTLDKRLRLPGDVLISDLDGETVLLSLTSESYFGLDRVGSRMLAAVTAADSVEAAYETLASEYDVDRQQLRQDLVEMLDNLLAHGLLEVQ